MQEQGHWHMRPGCCTPGPPCCARCSQGGGALYVRWALGTQRFGASGALPLLHIVLLSLVFAFFFSFPTEHCSAARRACEDVAHAAAHPRKN